VIMVLLDKRPLQVCAVLNDTDVRRVVGGCLIYGPDSIDRPDVRPATSIAIRAKIHGGSPLRSPENRGAEEISRAHEHGGPAARLT
jgi:hypothetical protein